MQDLKRTVIDPVRTQRARTRLDVQEQVLDYTRTGAVGFDPARLRSDPYYGDYLDTVLERTMMGTQALPPEYRAVLNAQNTQERDALLEKIMKGINWNGRNPAGCTYKNGWGNK